MVQNKYYKSVHDVSGLLQPGSLNQVFTLIYKFPIRSTLNFYLVKKMPYILALKISYDLFKVLINNEVKMYIEGDNHQTVGIWFNWRYLLHTKQQIIKLFIVHKNVFRISQVIFYLQILSNLHYLNNNLQKTFLQNTAHTALLSFFLEW